MKKGGRTFDLVEELIDTEFVKTIHQFAERKGGNKKTGLYYVCHSCKEVLWDKVSGDIGKDYKRRLKELTERERERETIFNRLNPSIELLGLSVAV